MFDKYIKKHGDYSYYIENLDSVDKKYEQCAYLISNAKNITFLTGAGISTSCGIPDFRSKNGWYSKSPEDILSFNNFVKNPIEVYNFLYKYYSLIDVKPSYSHFFISWLESIGKNVSIVTQNVDMLHSKAGSSDVIEYHGSFGSSNCIICNKEYPIESVLKEYNSDSDKIYKCNCGGLIKPNIVFFGESINEMTTSESVLSNSDLVIVVGTSLQVEPFSQLPLKAPLECPYIIINKTPTYLDDNRMSIVLNGDCDNLFKCIKKLL